MDSLKTHSHRRILVIDDNPSIHEDFRKTLGNGQRMTSALDEVEARLFGASKGESKSLGFEIDSAYQGQEGLALVQQALEQGRPYAMAFVDVRMPPGWDGIETTTQLWRVDPDMQIVICTAYSDHSWDEMLERLGTSDRLLILKKPFDNIEALQLANALTQKWHLSRQAQSQMGELERQVQARTRDLQTANEKLQREILEHKRAEAELLERSRLAAFSADVSFALTQDESTKDMLHHCAETLERHLDAALARIWTLNEGEGVLELQASAGLCTHFDGGHACVPMGKCNIGLIAEERRPYSTNEVIGDSRIGGQEWAKREGMVSFAGYPLVTKDNLTGVMAVFGHKTFTPRSLEAMAAAANEIALSIQSRKTQIELQKSNMTKGALLAALSSILIGVNAEGDVTQWNGMAESTFGNLSSDVVGHPFLECGIEWDWSSVGRAISQCVSQGCVTRLEDIRYRRLDGKEGFLSMMVNPIRWDSGESMGYLLSGTEVTERRMLEAQLRQAQKLESIGQLAAGIAHEINTPTQYVGDNTRFLEDSFGHITRVLEQLARLLEAHHSGGITAETVAEVEEVARAADLEFLLQEIPRSIRESLEGVDRVSKIVRSMKEFAHPREQERTAADLNKAIESTITVARNEWKYVAELVTNFDPDLPLVPCLLGDLNQVILNLIVNAAHAIAEKNGKTSGQKGQINVSTHQEADWVEIRVADTGTGIPERIRSRVFDPFFTTKEVGKGTGQGLAISHSVVEKHGGTITFETQEDQGTTFIIRLPLGGQVCS